MRIDLPPPPLPSMESYRLSKNKLIKRVHALFGDSSFSYNITKKSYYKFASAFQTVKAIPRVKLIRLKKLTHAAPRGLPKILDDILTSHENFYQLEKAFDKNGPMIQGLFTLGKSHPFHFVAINANYLYKDSYSAILFFTKVKGTIYLTVNEPAISSTLETKCPQWFSRVFTKSLDSLNLKKWNIPKLLSERSIQLNSKYNVSLELLHYDYEKHQKYLLDRV